MVKRVLPHPGFAMRGGWANRQNSLPRELLTAKEAQNVVLPSTFLLLTPLFSFDLMS